MKKIIITGSSSGIGLNAIKQFHALNYEAIGIDVHKNTDLPSSIQQYECDLLNEQCVEEVFKAIGDFDISVNCAGVPGIRKKLNDMTKEEFTNSFNDIFFPTFNAIKQELKIINNQPDESNKKIRKIINITSVTARYGCKNMAAYSSAKAALVNLTKVAAVEHAPYAQINSISPATVDTPMIRNKHNAEWPDYSQAYLTGDCGQVEDVFSAIKMMIDNQFMTGYDLALDGGFGASFDLKLSPPSQK